MDQSDTITERAARETGVRLKRKADPKKLAVAAGATVVFLLFVYIALGGGGSDGGNGVTVDALRQQSGNGYGLLTANGPSVESPALPERVAVAEPEATAEPILADNADLSDALASIRDLNRQVTSMHSEMSELKIQLASAESELSVATSSYDTLKRQYDQREEQFRSELAQAIAEAEARALANSGQPTGLSDEERRRLEELRAQRKRQNESDGIVFDENPYGRSN